MTGQALSSAALGAVFANFAVAGEYLDGAPYGNGHINDTYAVRVRQASTVVRFILQRVNHAIFKDVPSLMANIERVTAHLRAKFAAWPGHDPRRETLTLIPTRAGGMFHQDAGGSFWRVYVFIEDAQTIEIAERPEQPYEAARAFARFQMLLDDLPGARLHDTIPNFHHTPQRFAALERALERDPQNRAATAGPELAFARQRRDQVSVLVDEAAAGRLPERITHNDTKINNVMLDARDGRGLAVIDLDTVMPGLVLYDFGDQVRTTTCTGSEDETDLSRVTFRLDLFTALVRGYLDEIGGFLTPRELDHLAFCGRLITFEIGIRFLTDYIEGDVYFKTCRPGHNLERARTQFARVAAMEAQQSAMEDTVARHRPH